VMAEGTDAGETPQASANSLPAATTTCMPSSATFYWQEVAVKVV
jgi:hypothetical protein